MNEANIRWQLFSAPNAGGTVNLRSKIREFIKCMPDDVPSIPLEEFLQLLVPLLGREFRKQSYGLRAK
jgi:hypothetical protein